MRDYQKESERLNRARNLVGDNFPHFGVNKNREIVRLLYEISKREDILPESIIPYDCPAGFNPLKGYLLKRRFPMAMREETDFRPYLPGFELTPDNVLQLRTGSLSPRRIYIEEEVRESSLAAAFLAAFPEAVSSVIPDMKGFLAGYTGRGIPEYNKRSETIFIIQEERDFFKRCPCTGRAVPCGYNVFNLSFGCIYECTYCYLQEYTNTPGLIFPANVDHFLDRFLSFRDLPATHSWRRGTRLRLGTGEFSDSLMLDDLTGYSLPLVEFFRGRDDVIFEFKTKSVNIENLLKVKGDENIVVGWSVNPQSIIDSNELYSAPLEARIDSARRIVEAGYRVAFHFDPIFYYNGWEDEYREVIDRILGVINPEKIAWISLGTLRFKPSLKKIIEARFPGNDILDAEMVLGFDDKLRYPARLRSMIYRNLIDALTRHNRNLPIYLCMEERSMWEELKLPFPF